METIILKERHKAGLTLREVAAPLKLLGRGFSRAQLSLLERGLIDISASDQAVILETIKRLAPLHRHRRRIAAIARDMDFSPCVTDIRDARCADASLGG